VGSLQSWGMLSKIRAQEDRRRPPLVEIELLTPEWNQRQDWLQSHATQVERLNAFNAFKDVADSGALFSQDARREIEVVVHPKHNWKGRRRQDVIPTLKPQDTVLLLRELHNPWDSDAVAVCTTNFEQIGHLNKSDAQKIVDLIDSGKVLAASVKQIVQGTPEKPSYRLWLFVDVATFAKQATQ
jgi:hypothetical protein